MILGALVVLGLMGLVTTCFVWAIFGLVRIAAMRPVGGSGRRHIEWMLRQGFSVGRIVRELQVSRGLVLAVQVQMEGLAPGHQGKGKRR